MSEQQTAVLVVGAGPAGIAAACAAAESGSQVTLLDNSPWRGGQIWRGEERHPSQPLAQRWLQRLKTSGTTVLANATAFAAPERHSLLAETPEGVRQLRWQKLVLATGARELFLPFPGWTLPGVLGPGGLHAMAKAGWPVSGKRVLVAGSGPLLLAVADGLQQHGALVPLVAEQAPFAQVMRFGLGLWRCPGKLLQGVGVKARLLRVPYRCGCWPIKAEGTDRVQRVTLTDGVRQWTAECDYLACGFHLVPNHELPLLLGCELANERVAVNEYQETSVADIFCAGEPTGVAGAECALVEGQIAGYAAAGSKREAEQLFAARTRWHRFRGELSRAFALRPELRRIVTPETVVCRCEDVLHSQLESFTDARTAKLHTRCGMGPCQGRTCGSAGRFLYSWNNDSVRPPLFPVNVGSLLQPEMTRHQSTTISKTGV